MRNRNEIETDGKRVDLLNLEVLLDIRDIVIGLKPITIAKDVVKPIARKKGGRPKGSKNKVK